MRRLPIMFLLLCIISSIPAQSIPKLPNSYPLEQKFYELSMIWKEISYNFDNFQNDTQEKFDSIYQAYIPLIMATTNDLEYYKAIQRFLAHCSNVHTGIWNYDPSLDSLIARPYLRTVFRDNKILVSNFANYHANKLNVGDEILEINHISALEYMHKHYVPYCSATNESDKIHRAMFRGLAPYEPLNTPMELKLRNVNTLKNKSITILADRTPSESGDKWVVHDFRNEIVDFFYQDTIHKTSYVRLTGSSPVSTAFFESHILEINQSKTVILDLADHAGGAGKYDDVIWNYLINKDTIHGYYYSTRMHYPYYKGIGKDYFLEKYASEPQSTVNYYTALYKGTAYLPAQQWGQTIKADTIPHFQGNVYVITGHNCGSAGEQLLTMLSQDEKIHFFGTKTCGATGRPYFFTLPSGLEIMVETGKFYDFRMKDISTGINPQHFIDFFDCYSTSQAAELLQCINEKIKQALEDE